MTKELSGDILDRLKRYEQSKKSHYAARWIYKNLSMGKRKKPC